MGPKINNTTNETALPNSAAESDWAGVIPIVRAEKTVIASPTPKFPGVIPIRIERFPIAERKRADAIGISIPKTLN